jgi:hypothetical protein
MTDEQAVSMKEPGKKLGNLKELLPNSPSNLIQFGQYMATRLNQDDIVPMGFVLGCELALYDLQSGVDGFTGQTHSKFPSWISSDDLRHAPNGDWPNCRSSVPRRICNGGERAHRGSARGDARNQINLLHQHCLGATTFRGFFLKNYFPIHHLLFKLSELIIIFSIRRLLAQTTAIFSSREHSTPVVRGDQREFAEGGENCVLFDKRRGR